MQLIGEVAGFLGAWLEFMGLELALLAGFLGAVTFFTRGRSGRRDHKKAPHPGAYQDYSAMGGGDFG